MKEALADGTAETSFRLLEQFTTQDEPAYCGLSTLVMVLNTLNIDPGRVWKGPWRWFHEDMLDCCEELERVKEHGITFDQFCCLARCNGAAVTAHRPDEQGETLEVFRDRLVSAVSDPDGPVFVVSYSRKTFQQTGDGHYSPIGAYHRGKDAALILDVARFKLPPHWVPVPLLWEALQQLDSSTNRCRGYVLLCLQSAIAGAEAPYLSIRFPLREEMLRVMEETKQALEDLLREADAKPAADPKLGKKVVTELRRRIDHLNMGGLLRQATPREICDCRTESTVMRELRTQANSVLSSLGDPEDVVIYERKLCCGSSSAPSCGSDVGSRTERSPSSTSTEADADDVASRVDEVASFKAVPCCPSTWSAVDVLAMPPELWLPEPLLQGDKMLSQIVDTELMGPRLGAEVKRLRSAVQDYIDSAS